MGGFISGAGGAGEAGPAGPPGDSAYQVWLDAGNEGTVFDFIADLQGAAGAPGDPGEPGDDGAAGPAGLTWRGDWTAADTYAQNDAVYYNGESFRATAAIAPSATDPASSIAGVAATQGSVGLTGSTEDFNPTNRGWRQRFTTNASRTISGITLKVRTAGISISATIRRNSDNAVMATSLANVLSTASTTHTWNFTPFILPAGDYYVDFESAGFFTPDGRWGGVVAGIISAAPAPTNGGAFPYVTANAGWMMQIALLGNNNLWTYLARAPKEVVANTRTADYTLVLTDAGKAVEENSGSATVVTIPPNSAVPFPIGTVIEIARIGAGGVTITPGAGVTIPNRLEAAGTSSRTLTSQYSVASIRKRDTNVWVLAGDIS